MGLLEDYDEKNEYNEQKSECDEKNEYDENSNYNYDNNYETEDHTNSKPILSFETQNGVAESTLKLLAKEDPHDHDDSDLQFSFYNMYRDTKNLDWSKVR